jgi:hypothetical protein
MSTIIIDCFFLFVVLKYYFCSSRLRGELFFYFFSRKVFFWASRFGSAAWLRHLLAASRRAIRSITFAGFMLRISPATVVPLLSLSQSVASLRFKYEIVVFTPQAEACGYL